MAKVPDNIPPHLATLHSDKERHMSEKLKNHAKFNNKQDWFFGRKCIGKPAR